MTTPADATKKGRSERHAPTSDRFGGEEGETFRALDGELQTDKIIDREIFERMGSEFYDVVFRTAV